jgi:ribosomal subunit interface protein
VQIEYTGRHTDFTPALKALTEKKLAKLEKVLPRITQVHVILAVDKHRRIAELTVPFAQPRPHGHGGNAPTSRPRSRPCIDRLVRQAQKHRGKIKERKREGQRAHGRARAHAAGGRRTRQGREEPRFVAKPMTVDEAVLEVNASNEGLVVFRDAATERLERPLQAQGRQPRADRARVLGPHAARAAVPPPDPRHHRPLRLGQDPCLRTLEDMGWFCVDNLPTALIPRFADLIMGLRGAAPLGRWWWTCASATSCARSRPSTARCGRRGSPPGSSSWRPRTRSWCGASARRGGRTPWPSTSPPSKGIREEREALRPIRKMADLILDTSQYNAHQLRDYIRDHYDLRRRGASMIVSVLSFGYKYGVPSDVDLVFDARFLPNPNFVPRLKKLTGRHRLGRAVHAPAEGDRRLPAPPDRVPLLRDPALRGGGEELPDDRHRLHGRPPPLGDDRERAPGGLEPQGPPG